MRSRTRILVAALLALVVGMSCGPTFPTETTSPATATTTETPVPLGSSATATQTSTGVQTATSTTEPCTPDSAYVGDLNLPDGTLVSPGETVTKTWRIENDGDCTWTPDYSWEQIETAGNLFRGVPLSIPLTGNVPPGGTLDISVEIRLDPAATLGEVYTARFQLRSPEGDLFGAHPYARVYAVNGTGICPLAYGSLDAFVHLSDRFCFLYPDDHDAYIGIPGDTIVRDHSVDPGDVVPFVSFSNSGSTAGYTVQQWANSEMIAAMGGGPAPPSSATTVAGLPAVQTDGLPGILGNRTIYVIKGNTGFTITVFPVDGGFPTETAAAIALWGVVRADFEFFDP